MDRIAYNETLEMIFNDLEHSSFHVNFNTPPIIFICGGSMIKIGSSLREAIFRYFASNENSNIHDHLLAAENFKDYFKNGAYRDLMDFEDDIASISTLIIICLESAGSLVELGLFCNKPELKNRLLVFVPAEEVEAKPEEDIEAYSSFIYLGPLQSLKHANDSAVMIYPWPSPNSLKYEHIDLIAQDIENKLETVRKVDSFSEVNSGHLAFLIHDIIKLCEPIKLSEIELVLISLIIDCPVRKLTRLLYLLEKTNFIAPYEYSGSTYYYVKNEKLSKIKYGKSKSGKIFDFPNAKMQIRKSFAPIFSGDEIKGKFDDEISKKRYNALKRINAIREAQ
ncbi:retron St85 family effector protein [Aeromonas salmonicida]|uniref:retron St85 family effector protein n=1 Tax=Aeromonas salmonicida TaxID=645 RepID=UPI003D1BBA50